MNGTYLQLGCRVISSWPSVCLFEHFSSVWFTKSGYCKISKMLTKQNTFSVSYSIHRWSCNGREKTYGANWLLLWLHILLFSADLYIFVHFRPLRTNPTVFPSCLWLDEMKLRLTMICVLVYLNEGLVVYVSNFIQNSCSHVGCK